MGNFFEDNHARLENFSRVSQSVGARADYVQGGGGNTSVKLEGGLMAIKASGFCLKDIRPDKAYAVLDYQALRTFYYGAEPKDFDDVEKAGSAQAKEAVRAVDGLEQLRPSVEAGFHSILDTYVAHSHSVYANLAACSVECREIVAAALADAPYGWGMVAYTDPGARLTFSIRDELRRVTEETGRRPAAIFMQNHGLIVHADDPDECLRIHTDVNGRIAAAFGLSGDSFPPVAVREIGDGLVEADSPYLSQALTSGAFDEKFFLETPLYPDGQLRLWRGHARGGLLPGGSRDRPRGVQHGGGPRAGDRRNAHSRDLHYRRHPQQRQNALYHGRAGARLHRQLGEREVSQIAGGQEISGRPYSAPSRHH